MSELLAAVDQLRVSIADLGHRAIVQLPALLGAVALIVVGWLVARWLRRVTRRLGEGLNRELDRLLPTDRVGRVRLPPALARLLSNLVFWVVILAFVTAAAGLVQLEFLTSWLERILTYLPNLLVAGLIIAAGYLVGTMVRDLVQDALDSAGVTERALIGKLAQAGAFLAAVVMGIDQIGVDVTFVTTMIAIVSGAVLAGFSLAFGLGARQSVANLIACHALRRQYSIGQRARFGDIEGEIIEFTPTAVILATGDGRVNVPAGLFDEQASVLLAPEASNG
jgi:small-conductance mechanosensitive channel